MDKKRGGKRPGSGAKKKAPEHVRVRTTIQIPVWMVEAIDRIAKLAGKTRSTVIMDMISDKLGENRPDVTDIDFTGLHER